LNCEINSDSSFILVTSLSAVWKYEARDTHWNNEYVKSGSARKIKEKFEAH
jgi:hypothetical protein